jgi:serine/threonine protein phosphatase PrpC
LRGGNRHERDDAADERFVLCSDGLPELVSDDALAVVLTA